MIDFYTDKNVLVTGGGGFIGSHLVESLLSKGSHVRVASRRNKPDNLLEVIDKI